MTKNNETKLDHFAKIRDKSITKKKYMIKLEIKKIYQTKFTL